MVLLECRGAFPTGLTRKEAEKLASLTFRMAGGKGQAIASLTVVNDAAIKSLNRQYRGKNKVTDVLSFGFFGAKGKFTVPAASGPATLGDIFISLPQIKRQAKAASRPVRQEFALMVIHGILHLIGFDHETLAQEKRMFRLQQDVLLTARII